MPIHSSLCYVFPNECCQSSLCRLMLLENRFHTYIQTKNRARVNVYCVYKKYLDIDIFVHSVCSVRRCVVI
jgi:hypothetical protein